MIIRKVREMIVFCYKVFVTNGYDRIVWHVDESSKVANDYSHATFKNTKFTGIQRSKYTSISHVIFIVT